MQLKQRVVFARAVELGSPRNFKEYKAKTLATLESFSLAPEDIIIGLSDHEGSIRKAFKDCWVLTPRSVAAHEARAPRKAEAVCTPPAQHLIFLQHILIIQVFPGPGSRSACRKTLWQAACEGDRPRAVPAHARLGQWSL